MRNRSLCVALACSIAVGCGGGLDNPSKASPTTTTVPPTQTLYTITGTVSSAASGPLGNATVQIVDGRKAGQTANTDGSGRYTLSGLTFAGFTFTASAPGHASVSHGSNFTSGVTTATSNFTLLPSALFSRSGVGDNVFDVPTYITRVRVTASYSGSSQNFILYIAGRLLVNVILGTCTSVCDGRTFDGTYVAAGGLGQIVSSTGVAWTVTEVR